MNKFNSVASFAFCTVFGVLLAPLAVFVRVSRWAITEIGDAWDEIEK